MKFQDDISNMNTYIHTDKPKPICPPLFQSWGHKYCVVTRRHYKSDILLVYVTKVREINRI